MTNQFTKEEIIAAWKNPEVRAKAEELLNHPSGESFAQLTDEELAEVQGASDVKPETTPLCVGVIVGLTFSIKAC